MTGRVSRKKRRILQALSWRSFSMNSDVSVCSKANTSSKKLSILDKAHSESNDVSRTVLKALDEKDVIENNSSDENKNTTASNT